MSPLVPALTRAAHPAGSAGCRPPLPCRRPPEPAPASPWPARSRGAGAKSISNQAACPGKLWARWGAVPRLFILPHAPFPQDFPGLALMEETGLVGGLCTSTTNRTGWPASCVLSSITTRALMSPPRCRTVAGGSYDAEGMGMVFMPVIHHHGLRAGCGLPEHAAAFKPHMPTLQAGLLLSPLHPCASQACLRRFPPLAPAPGRGAGWGREPPPCHTPL